MLLPYAGQEPQVGTQLIHGELVGLLIANPVCLAIAQHLAKAERPQDKGAIHKAVIAILEDVESRARVGGEGAASEAVITFLTKLHVRAMPMKELEKALTLLKEAGVVKAMSGKPECYELTPQGRRAAEDALKPY